MQERKHRAHRGQSGILSRCTTTRCVALCARAPFWSPGRARDTSFHVGRLSTRLRASLLPCRLIPSLKSQSNMLLGHFAWTTPLWVACQFAEKLTPRPLHKLEPRTNLGASATRVLPTPPIMHQNIDKLGFTSPSRQTKQPVRGVEAYLHFCCFLKRRARLGVLVYDVGPLVGNSSIQVLESLWSLLIMRTEYIIQSSEGSQVT